MDCRTAERLISLQPDGQLTNEERAGLIAHVANCRACSWEQQLQERLSMTLRGIGQAEIEAPFELKSLVMNKLRPERRSVLAYIPAAWRKTVAAAAAKAPNRRR
jgi:anti-sigma factor RsiW